MIRKNIFLILTIGAFLIFGIVLNFNETLSREFENLNSKKSSEDVKINILNVKSRPKKGDSWIINFQTQGKADLVITPGDQATIKDLDFIFLKCGEEERVPQILEEDIIFYPDWFCDKEINSASHLVNIAAKHNLKFQFGNKIAYAFNSPDGWIGITSKELYGFCGGEGLQEALDGIDYWRHGETEEHFFIIELKNEYNITAVRGRSEDRSDPVDVDIYVSIDPGDWGSAVAENISTWQDTNEWQEVDTIDKVGRYIKVVIKATEDGNPGTLTFGVDGGMKIFDAYEEEPAEKEERAETILVFNQEWSTSSEWNYGSGTDLTSNTSTAVELDLPKPTSRFVTSTDEIYWGIGIPSTTSLGVYAGTTTFEAKAD